MEETMVIERAKALEREELLTEIYKKTFPIAAKYVAKMGGSFEEAKDLFHDALVIFYERNTKRPDDPVLNEKAFILGLCKNLWINRFRGKNNLDYPENWEKVEIEEDSKNEEIVSPKLMRFLNTAGKKCMELLSAFYYDNTPLTGIADQFGFSGVRSATAQKYKCLEKVRNTVKEKALSYEDFVE